MNVDVNSHEEIIKELKNMNDNNIISTDFIHVSQDTINHYIHGYIGCILDDGLSNVFNILIDKYYRYGMYYGK